jgi:DinB superfamily
MGMQAVINANTGQPNGLDISGAGLISIQQQNLIAHRIEQLTKELEMLVLGRDKIELMTRPEPGSWCVGECLDHLTQTTRAFLPAISAAVARAPKLKTNRRLRTGILPSLFIRNLNPPYLIRFKVLPRLAPKNPDSDTAWHNFVQSQSELLVVLSSAAGLAIDKVRIKSPVYARISYNIYGAFRMLSAHQSRHVWQISQILSVLDSRLTTGVA